MSCRHQFHDTLEIQGLYDGALFYVCAKCSALRHRWPDGTSQHRLAAGVVAARLWTVLPYVADEDVA